MSGQPASSATPQIPLVDLRAQYATMAGELMPAVERVLASGGYVQGREVEQFEQAFAPVSGARHAIAVNSGTSALHLALHALDIGPGDEVITTPHTFLATASAICYVGATPVFVDIDPQRLTLDPARLDAAISSRTRAIIPVHIYGQPADMDPIMEVARARGIAVIEDAAQAHLALYKTRPVGTIGRIGCFSFYPGKNLGACGEGGAVLTDDPDVARKVAAMRDWGQLTHGVHELPGYNFRMDAIQGAILAVKLRHLTAWTAARQRHAAAYDVAFARLGLTEPLRPCATFSDALSVRHLYVIRPRSIDRVRFRERLAQRGIATGVHYARAVPFQPIMAPLGYREGAFPIAEEVAATTVSLPLYPELTDEQRARVVASVAEALDESAAPALAAGAAD
jgi:dTDP-4-amino-4,6-dideoxygalactose transaminase